MDSVKPRELHRSFSRAVSLHAPSALELGLRLHPPFLDGCRLNIAEDQVFNDEAD
jgi:hypothetical protein